MFGPRPLAPRARVIGQRVCTDVIDRLHLSRIMSLPVRGIKAASPSDLRNVDR
jgi:hypothetical protein